MDPPDAIEVRAAVRLGWMFAEVRGRARPGGPVATAGSGIVRGKWVLPLGSERSPAEREVERQFALMALAKDLKVDGPVSAALLKHIAPASGAAVPPVPGAGAVPVPAPVLTYTSELLRLGVLLSSQQRTNDPQATATWWKFAELLYRWDAHIQDVLLAESESSANAYELGRALAETFWALDPKSTQSISTTDGDQPNPVSWGFLLGKERRAVISRLLGRLVAYFHPLTAPAIDGSVAAWGEVAANKKWRDNEDAVAELRSQTSNWYSLVVAGLDPETLLKPFALLRSWRIFGKTFRVFGLEMVIGVISVAAIAGVGLLAGYTDTNKHLQTAVAALGVLGVTGSALQARLKTTTQSAIARLRQDLSTDLVADQITHTPPAPRGVRSARSRRRAIDRRNVTAPLATRPG